MIVLWNRLWVRMNLRPKGLLFILVPGLFLTKKQLHMTKLKLHACLSVSLVLLTMSIQAKADPTASQIMERLQANYASIISYSDGGQTVVSIGDETNRTAFSICLARPNFYQIAWTPLDSSLNPTNIGDVKMAWSAGAGDFLQTGPDVTTEFDRTVSLDDAAGPSSGLTSVLPRLFYSDGWPDFINGEITVSRRPDEKIGTIDCYVVSWICQGQETTLWIGTEDFLIHQVRRATYAGSVRPILANTRFDFNLIADVQKADLLSSTVTETHNNIILNREYQPSDFSPFK